MSIAMILLALGMPGEGVVGMQLASHHYPSG
jgi:hypothetical protein